MPVTGLRYRRWPRIAAAILAVLLVLSLLWNWNWFKRPLQQLAQQQTGRQFFIDGNLDVDLGWQPRIVMENVRFQNAVWARQPEMFRATRAEVVVDLGALLRGGLFLPLIDLEDPRIELERARDGSRNWTLERTPPDPAAPASELPIGSLHVQRGELRYFDPAEDTDLLVNISTRSVAPVATAAAGAGVPADPPADPPARPPAGSAAATVATASGRFKSLEVDATVSGGELLALTDRASPYTLKARFALGRTRGTVDGSVTGLQTFQAARLQLDIRGDSLAALLPLTALALPETPPYRIAGLLIREGDNWIFNDFTGKVGDSDIGGDATASYVGGRPRLVAKLQSRRLDLDDLAGFVGANPQTGSGDTASAQQKKQAVKDAARDRVLPDRPINLVSLRSMDADVELTAQSIRNKGLPLDDFKVHLLLEQGQMRLDPLNFGVAGGSIISTVDIDARTAPPPISAKIAFSRLDLAKLAPGNSKLQAGAGMIGGRASLSGAGASTAALLGSATGDLGIAMRDGQFSNLLIEGVGLDGAEALRFLVGGDKTVRLRCAVMDFEAKNGVLTPRSFVVDTTDTNLHVEGSLNLRDETLDLTLHALPKDFSPFSLRSPLHLQGTFRDPSIRPDRALFLRGGAAVLLGLVNPLAALIPLIETGPGKNENCGALIAAVGRRPAATAGPPS